MSVTQSNPKLHGALSLVEIVPGLQVCIVDLSDGSYVEATVVTTEFDYPSITMDASGKRRVYDGQSIGVVPLLGGSWANMCLSEPDNPALERFVNTITRGDSAAAATRAVLRDESWCFYNPRSSH